ncbi:MAG: hypothetical protein ACREUZ_11100 [Burkholderiales bacterium]
MVSDMIKDKATLKRMAGAAIDPMPMSQGAFATFVKKDYVRWEKIVKDAGVEKQ